MPEPAAPAARAGRVSVGALFPAQADVSTLPAFAARVEDWGYDELWVVEDCFLSGGLVMAAGALAATESLKVGLGLMPSPLRNPLLAAMEIGALATMHPGRFTATFGHGVREWMRQAGAAPARPLAALGEVVSAVRALLRGETVSVQGSHVRLDGVALHSPPEHAPPVLIGSTGPRGLALARDLADGVLLPEGCSPAFIAQALRTAARPARCSRSPTSGCRSTTTDRGPGSRCARRWSGGWRSTSTRGRCRRSDPATPRCPTTSGRSWPGSSRWPARPARVRRPRRGSPAPGWIRSS